MEAVQLQPMPTECRSNDIVAKLPSVTQLQRPAYQQDASLKRHSACDECRTRKLKCSGQISGCDRCIKQSITCIYSEQKQMGRPRKKQKTDHEPTQLQSPPTSVHSTTVTSQYPQATTDHLNFAQEAPTDPSPVVIDQEHTDFSNICSGAIAQSIRDKANPNAFRQQVSQFYGPDAALPDSVIGTGASQPQYPLDITHWPDYSTLESLPHTLRPDSGTPSFSNSAYHTSINGMSPTFFDPDADPASLASLPPAPACTCLANAYLTLSTLSTLSSFPISCQTVPTLLAAQRTARELVYCSVCPQKFASGSQNLLLSCTLLTSIADQWHKVRRLSVESLRSGFRPPQSSFSDANILQTENNFVSFREGQQWRSFVENLIGAYVFGSHTIPEPPTQPSSSPEALPSEDINHSPTLRGSEATTTNGAGSQISKKNEKLVPKEHTLLFVIKALERRQRQWHNYDDATDEFPDRCSEGYGYHFQDDAKGGPHFVGIPEFGPKKLNSTHAPYCKVHATTHKTSNDASAKAKSNKSKEPNQENITTKDVSLNIDEQSTMEETTEQVRQGKSINKNKKNNNNNNEEDEHEEEEDDEHEENYRQSQGDHAVCLVMIKYALDIVRNLQTK